MVKQNFIRNLLHSIYFSRPTYHEFTRILCPIYFSLGFVTCKKEYPVLCTMHFLCSSDVSLLMLK